MPTYHVDLATDRGPQRVPFTLDDDRPLQPQMIHILEELRQRGIVLRGGPEDEVVIVWSGREVDGGQTPERLKLSPAYPIELKMRRRGLAAARRPEPAATPFLPRSGYIGLVAGVTGAGIAWVVTATLFTELGDVLTSYGSLDTAVAAVLGGLVGAILLGLVASTRAESVPGGVALGGLLGAVGAGGGALLGLLGAGAMGLGESRQSFIVARLLVWGLAGGLAGALLALSAVGRDRLRPLDGLLFGLGAGLVGGLLLSLPGPSDLWQLLGFLVIGAAIGLAIVVPGFRRSIGVVELEHIGGRSVGLLRHRGWEVADNRMTPLGRAFQIEARQGRCRLVPTGHAASEVVQVAGKTVTGPVDIVNQDPIAIGPRVFRFRRFPEASL